MSKFLMKVIKVCCIIIFIIFFIWELIIQFIPIPIGVSLMGAEWYILIHYWWVHLGLISSSIGVLSFTRK